MNNGNTASGTAHILPESVRNSLPEPDPRIVPLPALRDNYIWALHAGGDCVIVDPGDAAPVLRHLDAHGLHLAAILITHRHSDHIGGVADLLERDAVPVYGPGSIACVTHPVAEGDTVSLPGFAPAMQVMFIPGHTEDHIAYLWGENLFCGDTIFSAGCGRLMGGTAAQLHASLQRIAALPDATRLYCTHEYTLANLRFALAIEPGNRDIVAHRDMCETLRTGHLPTLPTTLGIEKRINPFLRCDGKAVRQSVNADDRDTEADVFAMLRRMKDDFR